MTQEEHKKVELEEAEIIEEATQTSSTEDEEVVEEVPEENEPLDCEQQLAAAEQQAAEYLDGWQRCQASFANFRKRNESEQLNLRKAANAVLLARLLPVLDDFERAFQALPSEFEGHTWLEGLSMIQRKVASILEAENVQRIELEPGDTFDPMFHQAVLYQEVDGFEEGQVVAIVEQGYVLGDRVLRPTMVVVAKATEPPPEEVIIDAEESPVETAETEENQSSETE
jgi:molecular chaperone GrpE